MDKKGIISKINANMDSDNNVVATLYKMGLLIFIPLVAVFFYLQTEDAISKLITGGYFCAYRRATGLYCPGCGGTRAAIYLARFHIIDSIKMNIVVPLCTVLYIYFMTRQTLHYVFDIKGLKEKHIYIMIGIFATTVVIRYIVVNFFILA